GRRGRARSLARPAGRRPGRGAPGRPLPGGPRRGTRRARPLGASTGGDTPVPYAPTSPPGTETPSTRRRPVTLDTRGVTETGRRGELPDPAACAWPGQAVRGPPGGGPETPRGRPGGGGRAAAGTAGSRAAPAHRAGSALPPPGPGRIRRPRTSARPARRRPGNRTASAAGPGSADGCRRADQRRAGTAAAVRCAPDATGANPENGAGRPGPGVAAGAVRRRARVTCGSGRGC